MWLLMFIKLIGYNINETDCSTDGRRTSYENNRTILVLLSVLWVFLSVVMVQTVRYAFFARSIIAYHTLEFYSLDYVRPVNFIRAAMGSNDKGLTTIMI